MKLSKADVRENFVRSSGKGGQNVNKVSTCVELVHIPTGIRVKCSDTRNRERNRKIAWERLESKLQAQENKRRAEERDKRARQKRKTRRAPDKVHEARLDRKRRKSEKKRERQTRYWSV